MQREAGKYGVDQDVRNSARDNLGQGARMIAAALVSAVVTATLVITIGQSVMSRHASAQSKGDAVLIRTSH